jgi:hypothetical protein
MPSQRTLLVQAMNCLIGETVWSVYAGTGTGSVIDIHIGKKVKRRRPIPNPTLDTDQRLYIGQYGLMIWSSWRVAQNASLLCGSWDDNRVGGAMLTGLKHLKDMTIHKVEVIPPFFDLRIHFEDAIILETFCADSTVDGDVYTIFHEDKSYTLHTNGVVCVEPIVSRE